MISRRSLLKRLGAFVAVVALAPEIAFASRLKVAVPQEISQFWLETRAWTRCQSDAYTAWRNAVLNTPENEALMRQ